MIVYDSSPSLGFGDYKYIFRRLVQVGVHIPLKEHSEIFKPHQFPCQFVGGSIIGYRSTIILSLSREINSM
ncbi:hypothetical protein Plhal703r1_c06g0035101 [Plasmopara halstedii]